jgi:hypothetical protein
VPAGQAVALGGLLSDAGAADTHTAVWTFTSADGTHSIPGAISGGEISATHVFTSPGVYKVTLTVTDDDGGADSASTAGGLETMFVVYDPSAGFVTGAGWIDSPAGAYTADPGLAGRANFGFVARYKKGQSAPDGQTQFAFSAAGFEFDSTSYDWLVVAGARAQFKGLGEVNGAAGYGFMLTAIDGKVGGGGGVDKLRMKVWRVADGVVIYDNQQGADDNAELTTAVGGGQILIKSTKKLSSAPGGATTVATTMPAPAPSGRALAALLDEALRRWSVAGEDNWAITRPSVQWADLEDGTLATSAGDHIWLDIDADGLSWFTDLTPRDDAEFASPVHGVDLLSVLAHELGHLLGHDHDDGHVMDQALPAGTRRMPGTHDDHQHGEPSPPYWAMSRHKSLFSDSPLGLWASSFEEEDGPLLA